MEKNPSPPPSPERIAREAEALRENLAKRKQQMRLRQTNDGDEPKENTKE